MLFRLIVILIIVIFISMIIVAIRSVKKFFNTLKEGDYLLYSYIQYGSFEKCTKVVKVISIYPDRVCVDLTPFNPGTMSCETITMVSYLLSGFSGIDLEKIDNIKSGIQYEPINDPEYPHLMKS